MRFLNFSLTLQLVVVFLFIIFIPTLVSAQESAGVGVKPALIEDKLELSESKGYSIEITNLGVLDQTFYLSKRDIIGVLEGGVPIFADRNSEITGFELSDWITLEKNSVFIPVGQKEKVNFILEVPTETSPGSHFGSILVSVEPPEIRSSGASIGYEVANIISIRIAGDIMESAQIRQFSTGKYFHSGVNVDFTTRIENEGNTLIRPVGIVEINNMFGKNVTTLNFNESQAGVFPKSKINPEKASGIRSFNFKWEEDSPGFGRYQAILSAVYGDDDRRSTMSSTVTFWILPMNIILPALGVLLTLFLIIYLSVRYYIKRTVTIMTAGSARRLVRRQKQNQFPVFLVFISMLTVTALLLIILLLIFS